MGKIFNKEKIINLGTCFDGNSIMVIFNKNRIYKIPKGKKMEQNKI